MVPEPEPAPELEPEPAPELEPELEPEPEPTPEPVPAPEPQPEPEPEPEQPHLRALFVSVLECRGLPEVEGVYAVVSCTGQTHETEPVRLGPDRGTRPAWRGGAGQTVAFLQHRPDDDDDDDDDDYELQRADEVLSPPSVVAVEVFERSSGTPGEADWRAATRLGSREVHLLDASADGGAVRTAAAARARQLTVTVVQCRGLVNKDGFRGKNDVYCTLCIEGEQKRTGIVDQGGTTPVWVNGSTHLFDRTEGLHAMHVEVFDHDDLGDDDLIGKHTVDLAQYGFESTDADWSVGQPVWFTLKDKKMKKETGEILLRLAWYVPSTVETGGTLPATQPDSLLSDAEQVVPLGAQLGALTSAEDFCRSGWFKLQPPEGAATDSNPEVRLCIRWLTPTREELVWIQPALYVEDEEKELSREDALALALKESLEDGTGDEDVVRFPWQLEATVLECVDLPKTSRGVLVTELNTVAANNPYVSLSAETFDDTEKQRVVCKERTSTILHARAVPKWGVGAGAAQKWDEITGEMLRLKLAGVPPTVGIEVWHEDTEDGGSRTAQDNLIGRHVFELSSVAENWSDEMWLDLTDNSGLGAGKVRVRLTWKKNGKEVYESQRVVRASIQVQLLQDEYAHDGGSMSRTVIYDPGDASSLLDEATYRFSRKVRLFYNHTASNSTLTQPNTPDHDAVLEQRIGFESVPRWVEKEPEEASMPPYYQKYVGSNPTSDISVTKPTETEATKIQVVLGKVITNADLAAVSPGQTLWAIAVVDRADARASLGTEEAATKLQAALRGRRARKDVRGQLTEVEAVQAMARGRAARIELGRRKRVRSAAKTQQKLMETVEDDLAAKLKAARDLIAGIDTLLDKSHTVANENEELLRGTAGWGTYAKAQEEEAMANLAKFQEQLDKCARSDEMESALSMYESGGNTNEEAITEAKARIVAQREKETNTVEQLEKLMAMLVTKVEELLGWVSGLDTTELAKGDKRRPRMNDLLSRMESAICDARDSKLVPEHNLKSAEKTRNKIYDEEMKRVAAEEAVRLAGDKSLDAAFAQTMLFMFSASGSANDGLTAAERRRQSDEAEKESRRRSMNSWRGSFQTELLNDGESFGVFLDDWRDSASSRPSRILKSAPSNERISPSYAKMITERHAEDEAAIEAAESIVRVERARSTPSLSRSDSLVRKQAQTPNELQVAIGKEEGGERVYDPANQPFEVLVPEPGKATRHTEQVLHPLLGELPPELRGNSSRYSSSRPPTPGTEFGTPGGMNDGDYAPATFMGRPGLAGLRLGELRRLAMQEGVEAESCDIAIEESVDAKSALIDLICDAREAKRSNPLVSATMRRDALGFAVTTTPGDPTAAKSEYLEWWVQFGVQRLRAGESLPPLSKGNPVVIAAKHAASGRSKLKKLKGGLSMSRMLAQAASAETKQAQREAEDQKRRSVAGRQREAEDYSRARSATPLALRSAIAKETMIDTQKGFEQRIAQAREEKERKEARLALAKVRRGNARASAHSSGGSGEETDDDDDAQEGAAVSELHDGTPADAVGSRRGPNASYDPFAATFSKARSIELLGKFHGKPPSSDLAAKEQAAASKAQGLPRPLTPAERSAHLKRLERLAKYDDNIAAREAREAARPPREAREDIRPRTAQT